jgi:hypothetical protein
MEAPRPSSRNVVHLTLGFALAALWMRVPITENSAQTS